MTPIYVAKLGFITQKTDMGAQKIDSSPLVIYEMALIGFSVQNKLENIWFFEETFMLAYTSLDLILRIPFLSFLDADM